MTDERRPRQGTRPIPNEEGLDDEAPTDGRPNVPHDEWAERALLGACLLSAKARDVLVMDTRPEDFYVPRHRMIAEAIGAGHREGWEVDPLTVADELARRGNLDTIGGPATLINLQADVPATSSAPRYAKIVHDAATLRRLLFASEEIGRAARGDGNAHEIVLAAHARLEDVASQNGARNETTLDLADTATILDGDLEPEEPMILARSDGRSLLYPGKMHMIQAEPSSGKTWLAIVAMIEVLRMGGTGLYLDFEDTSRGIIGRMLSAGATREEMVGRFQYAQPTGAIGVAERLVLEQTIRALNPDLVVIDGVAEALTREGLSEDAAADVVSWMDRIPRWIARTGAAVLMLDHVVKNSDDRGRYARGSGAKLAVIDGTAYTVKTLSSFSRTRDGLLRLIVAKDKPGGVGAIGDTAAMVSLSPKADGARVIVKVEPETEDRHVADAWRPTKLMARVSKELADSNTPLTAKALRALIPSDKPKFVSEAIVRLLAEGYVRETKLGSATVLVLVKPFHEDDDPPPTPPDPGPADEPPPELFDDSAPVSMDEWKDRHF